MRGGAAAVPGAAGRGAGVPEVYRRLSRVPAAKQSRHEVLHTLRCTYLSTRSYHITLFARLLEFDLLILITLVLSADVLIIIVFLIKLN